MKYKTIKNYYSYHKKNFYSQNGEDGILNELIKNLGLDKRIFLCEFGAWDGKFLSNTFNIVKNLESTALFIESDQERFKNLLITAKEYKNIIPVNRTVSNKGKNSLDKILKENNFPFDFDLLSIDVDGNDLEIWEGMVNFKPKIVIIEINSNIKPEIYQRHNPDEGKFGNSFFSTINIGKKKGYLPISHTGNLIFVDDQFKDKLKIDLNNLKNPKIIFNYDWINQNNFLIKFASFILPLFIKKKIPLKLKKIFKPTYNNYDRFN